MGKRIVDEDMRLNININGNEAKNELFELEEKVRDLRAENDKLERSIEKYGRQIEQNDKKVEKYTRTLEKERENVAKQEKAYAAAQANMTTMYASYKKLDQAGKESKYGQRLLEDIRKQEEAVRRSGESRRKSMQAVESLEKSLKKLGAENTKLIKKREEDTVTLRKNKTEIEANSGKVEKLRKNLNVTTLSIEELNREITRTSALFRKTDPNDPRWKEYQRTLVVLRKRHQELSGQAQATHGILCRVADGVNKYWNLVMSGVASFTGVVLGVKSAINKYVEFTDVLADVMKTTNLAAEEVKILNDEIRKIDTRSSQEELMGLARIGGKLGIEGRDNLLGFVRAADQINVALKEDLGGDTEEAIRQVGKIVDIFKVNEEFGIERGLLKVGSVINELGMASTANEGYIVEFTKRVAGIAPMMKVSVSSVMGLAATLDQFGQTSEVSSTVYSQVMTQMFKKTSTYAKIAGMDVKEFSGLLKSDANEAFIRVMEGLKGNNTEIENMIASMGDMGMEGKRAVGVLGVLAENTETLRAQQRLANEAFEEGISLTNEFGVKNNNLAAKRAKAKKDLDERIKQLGEKLYPLMTHGMSLMSLTVKGLELLISFTTKYGGKIVWLTGVLGTYWVMQKSVVAWRKIEEGLVLRAIDLGVKEISSLKMRQVAWAVFTGGIKRSIAAMKAFMVSLVMNPIGVFTIALVGLGTAFYKVYQIASKTEEGVRRSLERVGEAQREFARETAVEQVSIDRMFGKLEGLTKGTNEYQKAKDEILSKYGHYLSGLSTEIQALEDVKGAYEAISVAAKQAARDRAIDAATTRATEAYVEVEVENLEKIREALKKAFDQREAARYFEEIKAAMQNGGVLPGELQRMIDDTFTTERALFTGKFSSHIYTENPVQEAINNIRSGKGTLKREIDSVNELLGSVGKREYDTGSLGLEDEMKIVDWTPGNGGEKAGKYDAEIVGLKDKYAKCLITREEYENKLDALELAHLEYRLKTENLEENKRVELKQKIADKKIAIMEKAKKKEQYIENVIDSASPVELKEKKAYEERLRQAGLFGVEREVMTKEQLQALEILEKQHKVNLAKIEKDAKKKRTDDYMEELKIRVKNTEMGQAMEVAKLKAAQSAEIEGFSGSLYQRNEMLKRHQLEQLSLSEEHATEMIAVLGDIFGTIASDEITLGDEVLTEEQKNELLKRFEELKAAASGFVASEKELEKRQVSDVDVLGMSGSKWEEFFENLRKGTAGIQEIEFAVGTLGNAWSAYTKMRAAQTQKELKQYEQKTKKEKAELDKQLDSGQISQEQYNARVSQLDADLDAKKEKLEKEQRERERTQAIFSTTVSTAVGIAKAWELGPILGPIMSALVAAMGVMQIATIQAAQYAKGRYPVVGADDGRTYDAEYVGSDIRTGVYEKPTLGLFSEKEPEMVVDGNTTRKLIFDYPQVYRSIIDVSRGRVPRYANGKYPTENSTVSSEMSVGGGVDPEMKQLLAKNMQMMDKLMQMKFQLPMYGDNGLVKAIKKAQDYEKNTKIGRE